MPAPCLTYISSNYPLYDTRHPYTTLRELAVTYTDDEQYFAESSVYCILNAEDFVAASAHIVRKAVTQNLGFVQWFCSIGGEHVLFDIR